MSRSVVITGSATISAAGVGTAALVEAVRENRSCLTPIPEEIVPAGSGTWGKCAGFKASEYMAPLKARKLDRCSQMAVVAAGVALADAGIKKGDIPPARIGIILGCGFGGIANSEEFLTGYFTKGVEGLAPVLFPNTVANAPASNASIEHGLQGPTVTTVQRFCSAEAAFDMAYHYILDGRADVMLAGGVDELPPRVVQGFHDMGQLRRFATPFGEGAGILVLESTEHAARRGATTIAAVDSLTSIGTLPRKLREQGLKRLLPEGAPASYALSGAADLLPEITEIVPPEQAKVALAPLVGRSLGMGGLTIAALVALLSEAEKGVHLAASPEGPYFAISFTGGNRAS